MSTLKVNTLTDTAATKSVPIEDVVNGVARAWVNFDGTSNVGGFCNIRASYNVTSVTDNGTGDYTVNFTTAMPDANYVVAGSTGTGESSRFFSRYGTTQTTSTVRVVCVLPGSALLDNSQMHVVVFR
jgi:hypothetical protein